jgi:FMN phosphatase YigB (HAD superfamily)/GT2 family glycosyltransferase
MDNQIHKLVESLIEAPNVVVVSFDVFDTLFFRPGFEPSDLFHLLRDRAAGLLGLSDFVRVRAAAESDMAASISHPEAYRNLHTLEDIYRHIAKAHNLDQEKCLELCRFELELERTTLRPRNDVKRLYEKAVSLQKRVIVISDTYFSKSFLKALIEEKGFGAVSEVYVSNECRGRKDIGDIYSYVLEREEVEGHQVLHIGDNLHSDVEMALAAGITGVHCPSVIQSLLDSPESPWPQALADRANLDPAARLLLGLAINEWFAEHQAACGTSLFEDNLRLFGFVGLGPILFHIAHEIAESKDIQEGYPSICFASRDGHLPMRAYDLMSDRQKKIPSHYIYCGRTAYDIHRYKGDPAAFMSEKIPRSNGYTLRSLLKYLFEMKDGDLHDALVMAFKNEELDSAYLDNRAAIERVCAEYNERLSGFFATERDLAAQYYSNEVTRNASNRAIIFDVGYGGSVSRAIGRLTGAKIDKIYISGNDENIASDRDHGTSTRILIPDPGDLPVTGTFLLLEELFSPAAPACIGFRKKEEEIHPLFAPNDIFGQRMREDLAAIQESALDFVRVVKETFGPLAPLLRVGSAHHLMRPFQYAVVRSLECEERMFSNILFSDIFFHNTVPPLSTKVVQYPNYGRLPDRSGFDEPSRVTSRSDTPSARQFKIGIHLYLQGSSFLQPVLLAVSRIPAAFDLFITVNDKRLVGPVETMVQAIGAWQLDHMTVGAAGGDSTSSWIATAAAHENDYDLMCHFGAISPDGSSEMTPGWLHHLLEAMLSPSSISGILSCFAGDQKLGLLFPSVYREAFETMRMAPGGIVLQSIRNEMDRLLGEMKIQTGNNRSDFFFPIGDAFWCRPPALRPLVGWASEQEALSSDTCVAINRILAIVSSAGGFIARAFVPDAMLLRSYRVQGQEINNLATALAHTRQELKELAHTRQELDRITGSRAWRIASVGKDTERKARHFLKTQTKVAKSLARRLRTAASNGVSRLAVGVKIFRLNRFSADHPVFSVVIPIYNRTWQLDLAIDSILKQTFRNFELILVCDGSPADTMEIVDRYAMHPQVRVHKFDDNSGNACRGRNTGIGMARGTYVAFMDSDDISALDRLWNTLFHFLHDRADMVYGSVTIITDGTRNIDGIWDGQFRKSFALTLKEMEDVNPAWTSTVAVRREVLVRFGAFRTTMRYREDQELWLRLAYNGCKLYPAEEMLAYYRFHEGNAELLFKDRDAHWKELMLSVYQRHYEE